jgi:hypothetical protein
VHLREELRTVVRARGSAGAPCPTDNGPRPSLVKGWVWTLVIEDWRRARWSVSPYAPLDQRFDEITYLVDRGMIPTEPRMTVSELMHVFVHQVSGHVSNLVTCTPHLEVSSAGRGDTGAGSVNTNRSGSRTELAVLDPFVPVDLHADGPQAQINNPCFSAWTM